MTENILIIFNPNSGKGRGEKLCNRLVSRFKKNGVEVGRVFCSSSLEVFENFCTENKGNPQGFSLAIVIGGDGTLGLCVDRMIKGGFDIPIYPFGRGTANDFARFFKTNRSVKRVVKIICNNPSVRTVDLLKVNDRDYAVNVAGGGAFTNGVTKYDPVAKKIFGKLAYISRGVREAVRMKPQIMKFIIDGQESWDRVYFFLVLNTSNAGGLKWKASGASPTDGLLNIAILKDDGLFNKVLSYAKAKEITAIVEGPPAPNFTKTDIDGNPGGDYPMTVCIATEKLRVVVPE